jgi:phosphate-selective porin
MSVRIGTLIPVAAKLLIFCVLSGPAQAQSDEGSPKPAHEPAEGRSSAPARTEDRGAEKGAEGEPATDPEVSALRSKIDQLQVTLQQQQVALADMQKRLDMLAGRAPAHAQAQAARNASAATKAGEGLTPGLTAATIQAKPKDGESGAAGWNAGRAFIRSADKSSEIQVGGYGQLDFRGYQAGDHPPNTFLVRRARLGVEGRLQRYYDFKVEGDFADTVGTLLRDFYVNVHRRDEVQFRFGQFRVPISQEEIRSDYLQDFVERSLVNNLVPSRSPGLAVTGVLAKGAFEYQAGIFNGKGLLALNNNSTPEEALRLRFNPWKNGGSFWTRGLIFGGAATGGRSIGGQSVRGLTESRSSIFFPAEAVRGKYTRANAELTWLLGPAVIRAEYDQTNQSRDNLGEDGGNLPGVVAKGYMAQVTYLLTGESKPDAGALVPHGDLFGPGRSGRGFGAWD